MQVQAQLLLLVLCCCLLCCCMRWCCSCGFTASCSCFSSFFPWCSSPLLLLPLSSPLFVVFAASCAALLSLLCFFHSQTSMLKNTGLIDCIKARELHRPEAGEIFHVGLLVRSAALVLLLQSEADRLLSYLLAHLLSAAGREIWVRNADAICSSIPRWRQLGRTCLCSPPEMALLLVLCCCCASLRADLRESLTDERESKWPAGRQLARSREPAVLRKQEPSCVFAVIS